MYKLWSYRWKCDKCLHPVFLQAVILAIMRTSNYSRQRAEELFSKGVRMVREEERLLHKELLTKPATISEEDKRRYNARIAATAAQLQRRPSQSGEDFDAFSVFTS